MKIPRLWHPLRAALPDEKEGDRQAMPTAPVTDRED